MRDLAMLLSRSRSSSAATCLRRLELVKWPSTQRSAKPTMMHAAMMVNHRSELNGERKAHQSYPLCCVSDATTSTGSST